MLLAPSLPPMPDWHPHDQYYYETIETYEVYEGCETQEACKVYKVYEIVMFL